MTMDLSTDLEGVFADWATDITLWPGEDRELLLEKGGIFESPSDLVEVGGRVEHVALSPAVFMRPAHVQDLRQDDAVDVHPNPELLVEGGDFQVAAKLPASDGLVRVELMER